MKKNEKEYRLALKRHIWLPLSSKMISFYLWLIRYELIIRFIIGLFVG